MKNLSQLILTFLIFGGLLIFFSCQKDELPHENSSTDIEISNRTNEDDTPVRTVLGELRTNPFTVANIAAAHNTLYGTNPSNIEATNLYVKFTPLNSEDVKMLVETEEFFYDYPLEYEVISMGDYYFEPETPESLPELYAIVDTDFSFPEVPYEIIDELYLDKSDRYLIAQSFRETGNEDDINPYLFPELPEGVDPPLANPSPCPDGCVERIEIVWVEGGPEETIVCDCDPGGGGGGHTTGENNCGCDVYADRRKPGGCINVEDTELGMEGVQVVKVITKDTWFTEDETWTDNQGCWKINNRYSGTMWMYVKFDSDLAQIRGVTNSWRIIYEWLLPVKDKRPRIAGPVFNNIVVNYMQSNTTGNKADLHWGAATVNNALHDFNRYSVNFGITKPDEKLDIFAGVNFDYGYALMHSQTQVSNPLAANFNYFNSPFSPINGALVTLYLPEVYIGTNWRDSDRLKWLAYHEFAHASHYTKVSDTYWDRFVRAIVLAGGHGTASSFDAGIISLGESWADYIGKIFAHENYNEDMSIGRHRTYLDFLEVQRNEETEHIPVGYFYDLTDENEIDLEEVCDGFFAAPSNGFTCGFVIDDVSGFTTKQMFNSLESSVTNLDIFTENLTQTYLSQTPNAEQQIWDLLDQY